MRRLFNPQAADAAIAGLLTPDDSHLSEVLRQWSLQRPLRICSGGTTSAAACADQWTLDLRPHFQALQLSDDRSHVRIGAGCTMAEVLEALSESERTLAAGLSGHPGLGYVLTGGMGPLSRRYGLAIDQLAQIKGVWGNGQRFTLERPTHQSPADQHRAWRGLCGAAPFLGVVTEVTMATLPLEPLAVRSLRIDPQQLPSWMGWAEQQEASVSLQWHWADPQQIQLLVVEPGGRHQPDATLINGLHQLPALANPPMAGTRTHSEVVGLLGPACSDGWLDRLPALMSLMAERPHPGCSLACQQLGGATTAIASEITSFVHRQAIWKPWITAVWPTQDSATRQNSLDWLQQVWTVLEPICPGVHLAQLHDQLPWHQRELSLAFGPWLPGLRELKRDVDPDGNLPTL